MILDVVVPGVLLLGLVIFVHELGHFVAAKRRGVRVIKFSLGMGPEMVGFTRGETRYCLSWVPLGGFVQMAGDSVQEDGTLPAGGPEEFLSHPWPGRVLIAVAGPLANLVLAYVVLVVMCLIGTRQVDFPNVIGRIEAGSAAARAGFALGDRVMRVAGRPIGTWRQIEDAVGERDRAQPLAIEGTRAGAPIQWSIAPKDVREVVGSLPPQSTSAMIGSVATGMPAYSAGLKEGDLILAVDGKPVREFMDISPALAGKADQHVRISVLREGRTFDVDVKPMAAPDSPPGAALIGVEAAHTMMRTVRYTPGEAITAAARGTLGLVVSVYKSMWLTITQFLRYREYVGGPVFIAQMAREAARKGIDQYLYLLATINIAVMGFNLLPIPLLDGGHIMLAVLQALRRRALSARGYLNFQKVGLVFVGLLFVVILSKDILRPFQRLRAVGNAPRETTTVEPGPH